MQNLINELHEFTEEDIGKLFQEVLGAVDNHSMTEDTGSFITEFLMSWMLKMLGDGPSTFLTEINDDEAINAT